MDVIWGAQALGELARRVVVPGDNEHGNTGIAELCHLRHEEEAGRKVFPVPIVEVACEQEERHLFFDR